MCGVRVCVSRCKFTFHLLNVHFSIYLLLIEFQPCTNYVYTCTVNWFKEHLYRKLVLCVCPQYITLTCNVCPLYITLTCNVCPLYIPLSWIMSVHCTFLILVMSVPCTFLSLAMSIPEIFLSVCLQYSFTQNQYTVQVYRKPVYSIGVYKTSLQYRCTKIKFTVQLYTKQVYSTVHFFL